MKKQTKQEQRTKKNQGQKRQPVARKIPGMHRRRRYMCSQCFEDIFAYPAQVMDGGAMLWCEKCLEAWEVATSEERMFFAGYQSVTAHPREEEKS